MTTTPPEQLHGNNTTILLIEDDYDDQEFITEALLHIDSSLAIHVEPNGNKAVSFLKDLPDHQLPKLLILDYNLPEIDGAEVLQLLMRDSRYSTIPKIVWSTSNAPQYKKNSLELGAVLYMVKPSTIAGIERMAREMLDQCDITACNE